MAPNYAIAVCYGPQAQLETFLMSNIIPQRPKLNRQVWERLEQSEIRDYAPRYRQIWVIDGPVFRRPGRLRGGEDVPDACYKIIVREKDGQPSILAFIMPQTVRGTEPPSEFLTSVHEIEQETGLDFFNGMPPEVQKQLEANTASGMW
jgi:endonuclease G